MDKAYQLEDHTQQQTAPLERTEQVLSINGDLHHQTHLQVHILQLGKLQLIVLLHPGLQQVLSDPAQAVRKFRQ